MLTSAIQYSAVSILTGKPRQDLKSTQFNPIKKISPRITRDLSTLRDFFEAFLFILPMQI